MNIVKFFGVSDDIIQLEGALVETFVLSAWSTEEAEEGWLIAFSDGSLFNVNYSNGLWRIRLKSIGTDTIYRKEEVPEYDDNRSSDVVTIENEHGFSWAVLGEQLARPSRF
jgi:hypothetical protein